MCRRSPREACFRTSAPSLSVNLHVWIPRNRCTNLTQRRGRGQGERLGGSTFLPGQRQESKKDGERGRRKDETKRSYGVQRSIKIPGPHLGPAGRHSYDATRGARNSAHGKRRMGVAVVGGGPTCGQSRVRSKSRKRCRGMPSLTGPNAVRPGPWGPLGHTRPKAGQHSQR